jgi:hypothetical protein
MITSWMTKELYNLKVNLTYPKLELEDEQGEDFLFYIWPKRPHVDTKIYLLYRKYTSLMLSYIYIVVRKFDN